MLPLLTVFASPAESPAWFHRGLIRASKIRSGRPQRRQAKPGGDVGLAAIKMPV